MNLGQTTAAEEAIIESLDQELAQLIAPGSRPGEVGGKIYDTLTAKDVARMWADRVSSQKLYKIALTMSYFLRHDPWIQEQGGNREDGAIKMSILLNQPRMRAKDATAGMVGEVVRADKKG